MKYQLQYTSANNTNVPTMPHPKQSRAWYATLLHTRMAANMRIMGNPTQIKANVNIWGSDAGVMDREARYNGRKSMIPNTIPTMIPGTLNSIEPPTSREYP